MLGCWSIPVPLSVQDASLQAYVMDAVERLLAKPCLLHSFRNGIFVSSDSRRSFTFPLPYKRLVRPLELHIVISSNFGIDGF